MQCNLVPLQVYVYLNVIGEGRIINKRRVSCVLLPPSKSGGGTGVLRAGYVCGWVLYLLSIFYNTAHAAGIILLLSSSPSLLDYNNAPGLSHLNLYKSLTVFVMSCANELNPSALAHSSTPSPHTYTHTSSPHTSTPTHKHVVTSDFTADAEEQNNFFSLPRQKYCNSS